jgi:hypothetical protein
LPALVLKLDFAKAFDTVNWEGLSGYWEHVVSRNGGSIGCKWFYPLPSQLF